MARRNSFRGRKTEKEEVTWSDLSIDAGATQTKSIVKAEDSPTTAGEVEIGDHVNSIYFELNFSAQTITNTKIVHWLVFFNPNAALANAPTSYDTVSKRFILKRGMEMLPKDVGTVIKRIFVVKIPPKFRRIGEADTIQFKYQCSLTETINACGFAIYRHAG